ncbi:MAG TPA: YbaK/EbsC family protein [Candidatus Limnocylindria bacterium]|nr:YbaK/EbsC family protein [Candidatus Limnocylindria bacterium]
MRAYAAARGVDLAVRRFPAGTRTAEDAARAIGVQVGQIVKSLVFSAVGEVVVVLCSGASRVDERQLASGLGAASVARATADEAKTATGYAIGGVPPFGHTRECRVICDRGLLVFDVVWAASGLPDAVFPIAPADLVRLSGATVMDIAQ